MSTENKIYPEEKKPSAAVAITIASDDEDPNPYTELQVADLMKRIQNRDSLVSYLDRVQLIREAAFMLPSYFGLEGRKPTVSRTTGNFDSAIEMLELTLSLVADFAESFVVDENGEVSCNEAMLHACSHLMSAAMPSLFRLTYDPEVIPSSLNEKQVQRLVVVYSRFLDQANSVKTASSSTSISYNKEHSYFEFNPKASKFTSQCVLAFEYLLVAALYTRFSDQIQAKIPDHALQSGEFFLTIERNGDLMADTFRTGTEFCEDFYGWRMHEASCLALEISPKEFDQSKPHALIHFSDWYDYTFSFGHYLPCSPPSPPISICEVLWICFLALAILLGVLVLGLIALLFVYTWISYIFILLKS